MAESQKYLEVKAKKRRKDRKNNKETQSKKKAESIV